MKGRRIHAVLRKALPIMGILAMALLSMGQSGGFCPIFNPPPPPPQPPASTQPPDGFVGVPYSFHVGPGATGGTTDAPGMTASYVGSGVGVMLSGTPSRAGVFTVQFVGSGGSQRFTVHPGVAVRPPSATIAVGQTQQFSAHRVDDLNTDPSTWPVITASVAWTSALPSLATMSGAAPGLATGVAPSLSPVRIVAANAAGASGTANLTVTTAPNVPLNCPAPTQGSAVVGQSFQTHYECTDGDRPITYTVRSNSCSGSTATTSSTGVDVSWTPTSAGSCQAQIDATDAGTPPETTSFVLSVLAHPALQFSQSLFINGGVGVAYGFAVGTTGGSGAATFRQVSGTIPPGLTLSPNGPASIHLGGTPTTGGTYTFEVEATDNQFATQVVRKQFTVHILEITTTTVPDTVELQTYAAPLQAIGFTRPPVWGVVSGPGWLTADAASGVIGGIPPAAGTVNFTVQVESGGVIVRKDFTLLVNPRAKPPVLSVTVTPDNANPTPAQGFSADIVVSNSGGDANAPTVTITVDGSAFFKPSFAPPAGYTCIFTPTVNATRLDCTGSVLPANGSVNFFAPVDASLVQQQNVTTTVTAGAVGIAGVTASTPVTLKVPRVFVTQKLNLTGNVELGQMVTYEIKVENLGNDNATSFQVNDSHPAEMRFVSTTAANGALTPSPTLTQFPFGNIPAGQTITYQVVMQATAVGTFRNDAQALAVQPPQGQGVPPESAMVTVTLPPNIVSFAITPAPNALDPGETRQLQAIVTLSDGSTLDYTQFANWQSSVTGTATVSNTFGSKGTLTSVLAGVTTISASIPGTNLAAGFALQVNVTAAVLEWASSVTNSAPTIADDPGLSSTLTNTGTADAANVLVRFSAPPDVTFGTISSPSGFTCIGTPAGAPIQIDCSAASLAIGASALFGLSANLTQVRLPGPISFAGSAVADGISPRVFNTTISVRMPFVKVIHKQNMTGNVEVGQLVTFEITVENGGNEAATSFLLEDVHPQELSFVSTTAPVTQPVSVTPTRTLFTFGPLAAGPVGGPAPWFAFQVTMRANAVGTFRNDAKAFGVQPPQGTDVVISAHVTVTPAQPVDMSITASAVNATIAMGQQVELLVDAANLSAQDTAHNVVVEVNVPAGATFSSAIGPGTVDTSTPGVVRLQLNSVVPSTTVQHRLFFNTTASGAVRLSSQVFSANPDTDFSNNGLVNVDVTVSDAPVASFTANCVQRACTFDASASSDADGTIVSYAWDFGDSGSATGVNEVHTYATDGTFTVRLTVTDNLGLTHSVTQQVTVSAPPSAGPVTDILFSKGDGTTFAAPFVAFVRHDEGANTLTFQPPPIVLASGQPGPITGDNQMLVVTDNSTLAPANDARVLIYTRDAANNWVLFTEFNVPAGLIRSVVLEPQRRFIWLTFSMIVSGGVQEHLGVYDVAAASFRTLAPSGWTPRETNQLLMNPNSGQPFIYALARGAADVNAPEDLTVLRYFLNGNLQVVADVNVPFPNVMTQRGDALYIGANDGTQYVVLLSSGLPASVASAAATLGLGGSGLFGEAAFVKTVTPPSIANVCKYTLADVDKILMMEVNDQTPSISAATVAGAAGAGELLFRIEGHPTRPFLYVFGDVGAGPPPAPPTPQPFLSVYEVNQTTCALMFRTRVDLTTLPPGLPNGVQILPQ